MKIELDVHSDVSDALIKAWLISHREMAVNSMHRPCDMDDALETVDAIDVILRYMMSEEEFVTFSYKNGSTS